MTEFPFEQKKYISTLKQQITPILLVQDMPCLCKQWRFRSGPSEDNRSGSALFVI